MGERSHQENLYVLLRDAKRPKFLGQQAKKMHGYNTTITSQHSKEGIRTEDATAVRDGLSGRPGSCGMGPTNDGNKVRTGRATPIFLEQMDMAKNDAANMRRIKKGWLQYGVTDPWWVVHHSGYAGGPDGRTESKQVPRYNSEPILLRS